MTGQRRARLAEPLLQLLTLLVAVLVVYAWQPQLVPLVLIAFVGVWPPAVPWRPIAAPAVLRVYVPFALGWFLAVAGYLRVMHAVGHTVAPQPMLHELAKQGLAAPGAWLTILGIVVVAPIAEEILFRGYLFTALALALPVRFAQFVTAVLFGLAHGLDYALPIGVLALLFGWLRQRHGALWPSVLAHMVHNGLTVLMVLLLPSIFDALYPT